MESIKAEIQRLRGEYMDTLRDYLRSSIHKELFLDKANRILEEMQKLTNNPRLIGFDVVMDNIPIKGGKK